MRDLVKKLRAAAHRKDGKLRTSAEIGVRMKAALDGAPCVPVGDSDVKTQSPGTYRPVGLTCPPSCPFLGNGCYAQGGNVGIHEKRADASVEAAINGAAIAMVWAALTWRVARLHVSGDVCGTDGEVDYMYVLKLAALSGVVRREFGLGTDAVTAWSYTHAKDTEWAQPLRDSGVAMRQSDAAAEWGAIVADFDSLPDTDVRLARCPAQLTGTNCNDCRLCWERPDLCIVFKPHGSGANKARAAARPEAMG